MSTDRATPGEKSVRGWAVWPLRIVVLLTTLFVFLQPVLAGMFVTGNVAFLGMHSAGAVFVALLTLIQIVAAVLAWRPGRVPAWPIWASVAFFALVATQMGLGYARERAMHIPLGTLLFVFALLMLVGVWSRKFRTVREKKPDPTARQAAGGVA